MPAVILLAVAVALACVVLLLARRLRDEKSASENLQAQLTRTEALISEAPVGSLQLGVGDGGLLHVSESLMRALSLEEKGHVTLKHVMSALDASDAEALERAVASLDRDGRHFDLRVRTGSGNKHYREL